VNPASRPAPQPAEPPGEIQRRAAELRGDHQRREGRGRSEPEGADLSQCRVEVEELRRAADDEWRGQSESAEGRFGAAFGRKRTPDLRAPLQAVAATDLGVAGERAET